MGVWWLSETHLCGNTKTAKKTHKKGRENTKNNLLSEP